MNSDNPPQHAVLSTLRVWQEAVAEGVHEWRGRVQRLPDGDGHYFRSRVP